MRVASVIVVGEAGLAGDDDGLICDQSHTIQTRRETKEPNLASCMNRGLTESSEICFCGTKTLVRGSYATP